MSESLQKTYEDDPFVLSSNNTFTSSFKHPQVIQSQHLTTEEAKDKNIHEPTGEEEMQLRSSNANSISTFANIDKNLIEDTMQSSETNDSAPCDRYSLDKSVEAAADSNISVTQTKNVDRTSYKQGKSIGGNKRSSVTIPRTHKSQQHNIRQSFQGNGRNQATALSRSYQHPSNYTYHYAMHNLHVSLCHA